jgi:hypothetical protein
LLFIAKESNFLMDTQFLSCSWNISKGEGGRGEAGAVIENQIQNNSK